MNEHPEEAEWPRTIFIRPKATEVIRRELDEDYDPEEDSGIALAFIQGTMIESVKIESWDHLNMPIGYELLNDKDRDAYNSHLEMKKRKKRRA